MESRDASVPKSRFNGRRPDLPAGVPLTWYLTGKRSPAVSSGIQVRGRPRRPLWSEGGYGFPAWGHGRGHRGPVHGVPPVRGGNEREGTSSDAVSWDPGTFDPVLAPWLAVVRGPAWEPGLGGKRAGAPVVYRGAFFWAGRLWPGGRLTGGLEGKPAGRLVCRLTVLPRIAWGTPARWPMGARTGHLLALSVL